MASAPTMLIVTWNASKMQDPERQDHAYTEVGCLIQNVHLESVAWGLVADWTKVADEDAMKSVLGLVENTDINPLTVVTVGRAYMPVGDINGDGIVDIFDVVILANAFGSKPGDPHWNPEADLNIDDIIDIFDAVTIAKNFGAAA